MNPFEIGMSVCEYVHCTEDFSVWCGVNYKIGLESRLRVECEVMDRARLNVRVRVRDRVHDAVRNEFI